MQLFFAFLHNYNSWIEVPNSFYSLNWTERAYDYGQFELQLYSDQPGYEYSLGNLFIRDDTDTVMVIETATVKQEDDGVYLHKYTGRSLESMFEWRVLPHRQWIEPDKNGQFDAQMTAENLAHAHLGKDAEAARRIDNFNFHRETRVSQMAYVNDTGQKIQDGKWIIYDRAPISEMFRNVLSACKPNGYSLFYKIKLENQGIHCYVTAPHLINTITLAQENDNFSDFESVDSIVDKKSTIYEVWDSGDVDLKWIADGSTHTRAHTLRSENPITRREVLWDNTQVHKPYSIKDWKALTDLQRKHITSLSEVWYPFWVLDAMFPKYTPLKMISGKINSFSNVEYRTGFDVGDIFYYVPSGSNAEPIECQLTEMTESWSSSGFSRVPTISMSSRTKWNGDGFRIDFTRGGPGEVIAPRERD